MKRRPRRTDQDSGAALILAIGFVLAVGTISGGLAGLATSGLNNRQTLKVLRDREYAADAAIESAITKVRPLDCSSTMTAPVVESLNSVAIRVQWVNACTTDTVKKSDGSDYPQRNVIFEACLDPDDSSACLPADFILADGQFDSRVIIRAQVNFEPVTGLPDKTLVQAWSVRR